MIICVCKVVSDRTLRQHIEAGTKTVSALGKCTGAGTDCGACCRDIRELLQEVAHEELDSNVISIRRASA